MTPDSSRLPAHDDAQLEPFVRMSELLVGISLTDRGRAKHYLSLLRAHDALGMDALLAIAPRADQGPSLPDILAGIRGDAGLLGAAQRLTLLWYGGGLVSADGKSWTFAEPADYFAGLVWPLTGGHPPGNPGGYYGHWRYPAEGAGEMGATWDE